MKTDEFERIVSEQIKRCVNTLNIKSNEYATDDRLHNFKIAAALEGITPIQALQGMMAKHTVSVYDMCQSGKRYPIELWDEKIGDSINYLLLLAAPIREE